MQKGPRSDRVETDSTRGEACVLSSVLFNLQADIREAGQRIPFHQSIAAPKASRFQRHAERMTL